MRRRFTALLLIAVLCFAGCQEKNPDPVIPTDVPTLPPTATGTPTAPPTETPEPTSELTATVAPTATTAPTETPIPTVTPTETPTPMPTATAVPTVTTAPQETVTPVPTQAPESPFDMVTPVPQSEVVDIVGTMTVEDYPVVDGSTATLPLSEAVFMAATGESAEVAAQTIKHTKTTNSYYRLYDKEADLLIVYEPAEAVVERMKNEPILIKPIGLDALVFMANAANKVDSLTIEQLVAIYSGQIKNWVEVGGEDQTLLAFQRPVGSGSQSLMQKLVMGDVEMTTGDNVFRYSTMSDILEGMLSYNGEDNTLGYSVFYYANNMYFEKDLKFMGVNGVLPSTQTIYDGTYPCVNAFYAAIRVDEPADSNARKIFDWLTGGAGQQMVLDLGYVPVQMPEGADISDVKTEQTVKREVLAKTPLEAGQYFVMPNPQNTVTDYYYGDMTVYNSSWEEVANFYNVTLLPATAGVHSSRYLPIGQIRQNTAGEQEVRYGIFDLVTREYCTKPTYQELYVLDAAQGYYGVPQQDTEWMMFTTYQIVGPTGEVLLDEVTCDLENITIFKLGNGYLEMDYDYENWENGCVYRFFDKDLKLVNVFCEKAARMPDDIDRAKGVGYYLIGEYGCLIDENGEVLITADAFLSRYGDGEDMECILPFYTPNVAEGESVFGIYYKDSVYVVDQYLDLISVVYDVLEEAFHGAYFFEDMYYYWEEEADDIVCKRYDGSLLTLQDGRIAEGVVTNWYNEDYLVYSRDGATLYIDEYIVGGGIVSYTIPLRKADSQVTIAYDEGGYVSVSEDSGLTRQNMYSVYYSEMPLYYASLYFDGERICEELAIFVNSQDLGDGRILWHVNTGEMERVESESIFEENGDYDSYTMFHLVFTDGGTLTGKFDRARVLFYGTDAIILSQGNYVYAVSADGEVLVRELQNLLGTD